MCRFQRRATGKLGDGIVFGGCWLPTVFFASVIVIPVVNDAAVIVQNTPLCAGFQFDDVEAVAFYIAVVKVVAGVFCVVVIDFGDGRKCYAAVFVVNATTVINIMSVSFGVKEGERGHLFGVVVLFNDARI